MVKLLQNVRSTCKAKLFKGSVKISLDQIRSCTTQILRILLQMQEMLYFRIL